MIISGDKQLPYHGVYGPEYEWIFKINIIKIVDVKKKQSKFDLLTDGPGHSNICHAQSIYLRCCWIQYESLKSAPINGYYGE